MQDLQATFVDGSDDSEGDEGCSDDDNDLDENSLEDEALKESRAFWEILYGLGGNVDAEETKEQDVDKFEHLNSGKASLVQELFGVNFSHACRRPREKNHVSILHLTRGRYGQMVIEL